MSEAKRAYDILRGYVNQEWDRIKNLDGLSAFFLFLQRERAKQRL